MKKILFHTYQLNYSGSTNALVDYARYNQELLGNESVLLYNPSLFHGIADFQSEEEVVNQLSKHFKIETYQSEIDANRIAEGYDLFYTIRGGGLQDPVVESAPMAIHAVFQYCQPHGARYAYVSEWLSKKMSSHIGFHIPFVPHIINMPDYHDTARSSIRQQLNIPKDAFVFGRHGGNGSFNLPFVYQAIHNILNQHSDIYFVFLNTRPFYYHPNIRYLQPIHNSQEKSNFISACDAMIHARSNGESFGIAISEFMFHNKPVLSWEGGEDQHHVQMLNGYDSLYNEHNIEQKLLEFTRKVHPSYKSIVQKFSPNLVMDQFNQVFLS